MFCIYTQNNRKKNEHGADYINGEDVFLTGCRADVFTGHSAGISWTWKKKTVSAKMFFFKRMHAVLSPERIQIRKGEADTDMDMGRERQKKIRRKFCLLFFCRYRYRY